MLLNMELSVRRKRRIPQRRPLDVVKESMQIFCMTEADVSDGVRWRQAVVKRRMVNGK